MDPDLLPKIISVDDHVVEPPHVWDTWLPAKFRDRGPKVVRRGVAGITSVGAAVYKEVFDDDSPNKADTWVYEDLVYTHKRHVAAVGYPRDEMTMTPITYDDMRPGCYDQKARLADMDVNWVEASACYPTFPRFCGQTFSEGKDKELGLACVEAYNNWTVEEWCGDSAGRLIPICLIPLWDADLAAAEVRRNATRGVRAVAFSEIPAHLGLPSIHSGFWDPFFAACEETHTTVCMHIGSSSRMPATSADAPPSVTATLGFGGAQMSVVDFLWSGLLVRYPGLKLAYAESQLGWLPYILERIDDVWEDNQGWAQTKHIPEPPSTYFHRNMWSCFFKDQTGIDMRDKIGIDRITFETDYPHSDSTWPDTKAVAAKLLDGLTTEEIYRIVRGNAIDLFEVPHRLRSLMDLAFSADDVAFRDEVRTWLSEHAPKERRPRVGKQSRDYDMEWQRKMYDAGWGGVAWPVEYGGRDLPLTQQLIWYEEYARTGMRHIDHRFVGLAHAGPTLMARATQEQRSYHLPKILRGDVVWCQGFSEPEAGSDLASLKTRAIVDGDQLVVTGQKIWTSFADQSDWQELLVRTNSEVPKHKGITWVICDMRSPNIEVRPIRTIEGGADFNEVFYDEVRIPVANVVGGIDNGWSVAMSTLSFERGTAFTIGQVQLANSVEELIRLARSRTSINGTPVISDGALADRLARARADCAALRALTYLAISRNIGVDQPGPEGSMMKLQFSDLGKRIYKLGMDILGPRSLAIPEGEEDTDWVERHLLAYSMSIGGGTSEIQRNIIGERVLGLPR